MANENNILTRQKFDIFIILLLICIILGTFLRISLLAIYPLVAIFIAAYFRFKITLSFLVLLALSLLSFGLSLFPHLLLRYKVLSLFYMIPFLLLLFGKPNAKSGNVTISRLDIYIKCLTAVALVNDLIGFVQVVRNPGPDDSFIGIYTDFSISINGLMLLNIVIFFYYFVKYAYTNKAGNLLLSLFFLTAAMLGFYGAGVIISMVAFILSFFRLNIKYLFKTIIVGLISISAIYLLMQLMKPQVLYYNISNIKKLARLEATNGPRKITSFYNYFTSYPFNAKDFVFGSGPGTFNSRSAFMIGSPSYFTGVRFIKDEQQPYYFKNYAYTLWNEKNTIQALYLDGFRNQPFSSILAFLGEYGLLFTLSFFLLYYHYYRKIASFYHHHKKDPYTEIYFRFFKFLIILLPLLLLIDNYLEYPEIMLLTLLGLKLAETDLISRIQNDIADAT